MADEEKKYPSNKEDEQEKETLDKRKIALTDYTRTMTAMVYAGPTMYGPQSGALGMWFVKTSDSLYCPECGRAVQKNDNFCSECGAPLKRKENTDGEKKEV